MKVPLSWIREFVDVKASAEEIGTLMGVPMRPEQIQDLMRAMNVPKAAQTNPEESPSGDDAR